ncbi:MAG: hypothetical protein ACLQVX_07055 [Limisphaerales bacterium]
MTQKANVTALDALDAFRADLVLYISKARPTIEEVSADVLRTRLWLENEQRAHWESELRLRTRAMEEAQQALFSARIDNLREETSATVVAVHRAKRAKDEADDKLRTLKRWHRDFENHVQPLVKQTEKLHTLLAKDLVQAIAYLAQAVSTLDAYAGTPPPSASPGPAALTGAPADTQAASPTATPGAPSPD